MNQPTILDMKREAAQALLAYRRMKNTLLLHDAPELLPEQAETMTLPEEASRAGRRRGKAERPGKSAGKSVRPAPSHRAKRAAAASGAAFWRAC